MLPLRPGEQGADRSSPDCSQLLQRWVRALKVTPFSGAGKLLGEQVHKKDTKLCHKTCLSVGEIITENIIIGKINCNGGYCQAIRKKILAVRVEGQEPQLAESLWICVLGGFHSWQDMSCGGSPASSKGWAGEVPSNLHFSVFPNRDRKLQVQVYLSSSNPLPYKQMTMRPP